MRVALICTLLKTYHISSKQSLTRPDTLASFFFFFFERLTFSVASKYEYQCLCVSVCVCLCPTYPL